MLLSLPYQFSITLLSIVVISSSARAEVVKILKADESAGNAIINKAGELGDRIREAKGDEWTTLTSQLECWTELSKYGTERALRLSDFEGRTSFSQNRDMKETIENSSRLLDGFDEAIRNLSREPLVDLTRLDELKRKVREFKNKLHHPSDSLWSYQLTLIEDDPNHPFVRLQRVYPQGVSDGPVNTVFWMYLDDCSSFEHEKVLSSLLRYEYKLQIDKFKNELDVIRSNVRDQENRAYQEVMRTQQVEQTRNNLKKIRSNLTN